MSKSLEHIIKNIPILTLGVIGVITFEVILDYLKVLQNTNASSILSATIVIYGLLKKKTKNQKAVIKQPPFL